MATAKVAVTLEEKALERLDQLIRKRVFPKRSRAIQQAVEEKLDRVDRVDWHGGVQSLILRSKRPWLKKGCPRD